MRRLVILFLLVLLPIEVLAGISYEQHLAFEARETGEHSDRPVVQVDFPAPLCNPSSASDMGESSFALDLGEAFDVPCQSARKPTPRVASPPTHISFCDKSVVVAVPTRPAI